MAGEKRAWHVEIRRRAGNVNDQRAGGRGVARSLKGRLARV